MMIGGDKKEVGYVGMRRRCRDWKKHDGIVAKTQTTAANAGASLSGRERAE